MRTAANCRAAFALAGWVWLTWAAAPAGSALAQRTTNDQTYAAVAEAVSKMAGRLSYDDITIRDPDTKTYDLVDCGTGRAKLGISDTDPQADAAGTAVWALLLRNRLSNMGLAEVGEPYIRRMEAMTVSLMGTDYGRISQARRDQISAEQLKVYNAMAQALNSTLRARHLRDGFRVEGGCGAGEVSYRLAPSDTSARLFVIKQFYFLVCQARGLDPLDRNRCSGWHEATGRDSLSGAGSYAYVAVWSDGSSTNGKFEITDKIADDIDSQRRKDLVVIPIRR